MTNFFINLIKTIIISVAGIVATEVTAQIINSVDKEVNNNA